MTDTLDPLTAATLTFLPPLIQRRLLDEVRGDRAMRNADMSVAAAAATPGAAAARTPIGADDRRETLMLASPLEPPPPANPSLTPPPTKEFRRDECHDPSATDAGAHQIGSATSGTRAPAPPRHTSDTVASQWWRLAHLIASDSLGDPIAARRLLDRAASQAETALTAARRAGIDTLIWGHASYPPLLAQIAHPPFLLWYQGDPASLAAPCLAIVGSRAASDYALLVATQLAADLARAGLTIVSGLARGADSAAHRGAMSTGRTAAILGSGLDRLYPPEHDRLAAAISTHGGIVLSEFAPGTPPRRDHFPRRNRLISGLALGVLVIEASERSGSLQTARFAAEQGREVMAVPGGVLSARNRGAHALLRDGAILVECAADVIVELRLPEPDRTPSTIVVSAPPVPDEIEKDEAADRTLSAMKAGEVYDLQALVESSGCPAERLLRDLLLLELEGRVTRTSDGRFLRAGRPVIR